MLLTGELGEALGDGGLPRRRPAGDADQERSTRQVVHGAATLPATRMAGGGTAPGARVTATMPT
jgi:hypothetical protein